jgi:hypothetical protein
MMERVFLSLIDFRLCIQNVSFVLNQIKNFTFKAESLEFAFRKLLRSGDDDRQRLVNSEHAHNKKMAEALRRNQTINNLTTERQIAVNFHKVTVSQRTQPRDPYTCEKYRFECCCEILKHAVRHTEGTKTT